MKKILVTAGVASIALAVSGFAGNTFYQNNQDAKALAAAQAEYDAFDSEVEEVWDLLVELDVATTNGLTYAEHDDLTDAVTSEFARLDVEGTMAENVVDDIERVIALYGDANMAWNSKIYGDASDLVAEAELQAAWADAATLWGDVVGDVEDWESSLDSGEVPTSSNTI